MNQDGAGRRTLVVLHGYSGDADCMKMNLPLYEHHGLPILALSPVDAPITDLGPHMCRQGGKRSRIGCDSIERQVAHYKMALEYDVDFYLLHDADSVCLEPNLPEYLYLHRDELFGNEVVDYRDDFPEPDKYHVGFPKIAIQPPYFMSKKTLQKMVDVSDGVPCDPASPYQDWYPVQLCTAAGVRMSSFHTCHSSDTREDFWKNKMHEAVRDDGATFLHCVKTLDVQHQMTDAYFHRKSRLNASK